MTTTEEAKAAEKAAKEAADAAKRAANPHKTQQQPLAPMPSTDEGGEKKQDKGDWAMM
jgi:hypothetical protein